MKVTSKSVRTVKMGATCSTHARTDVKVRDVELIVDEPLARGGTNMGFSPTETFMASLIGCTNVIINSIAHKMGVEIANMNIEIDYDFAFLGARVIQEVALPFPEVRMTIDIKTNATSEQIDKIKEDLARFCPVAKMIRNAGCNIVETWAVTNIS
ncbi:OsmC family protein [Pseudomonadota bacterium]